MDANQGLRVSLTTYFNIILRLTIWFLLTADLSLPNIILGIAIALLLPRGYASAEKLKDWLQVLWEVIVAVPQAYLEAIEIMLRPHNYEEIVRERVRPQRTPGLVFLDIYVITFTPKTIVLRYLEDGWYEVHYVTRRREGMRNEGIRDEE